VQAVPREDAGFERLFLKIARRFLNLPAGEFRSEIVAALGALGELTGVDRVTAYGHDRDGGTFHRVYEWCAEGIGPSRAPEKLGAEACTRSGLGEIFSDLEPIEVSTLPPEAEGLRSLLEAHGVRSAIAVPVSHRERLMGVLSFSSLREEKRWTEESLLQLKVFGEMLASALVRREVEEALSEEEERAQVTLASIGDGVIRTDARGRIDYLNPVAEEMTGWTLDDALGREVSEVYHVVGESSRRPRRDPVAVCRVERRTISLPGLYILQAHDGREHTIRDSVAPIFGKEDELIGTVLVFKDLTEFRGLERQMVYAVSHDPLTGLLNRSEFEIHLEAALEGSRREDRRHALLHLDVYQFRLVNEACGHVAGDELLRQISALLKARVRQGDVLGRLGGDEFGVLLLNTTPPTARRAAGNLLSAFRDFTFEWGGQSFDAQVSLGIVMITAASESVTEILKAADAACAMAREEAAGGIHEWAPDEAAYTEHHGQVQWVHRLRRALSRDRLCLYHQRIKPLATASPWGFQEVLVRMVGDDGEHIPPGAFIPVAERYRIAPMLDRWVVRHALKLLSNGGGEKLGADHISINLSGQSLGEESFLHYLVEQIELSEVPPERLYFEITETAAVANLARAVRFMEVLREKGCQFILDDFGSGLSSFAYLKNLPVAVLKIDGEFVRTIEKDPIHRAMVEAIHQIGHLMGLPTIAEWVENEATYEMLKELEVDFAQGYWIHRPELWG